jgi:hypothetical protein
LGAEGSAGGWVGGAASTGFRFDFGFGAAASPIFEAAALL